MPNLVSGFEQNKPLVLNPKFIQGLSSVLSDTSLDKVRLCIHTYHILSNLKTNPLFKQKLSRHTPHLCLPSSQIKPKALNSLAQLDVHHHLVLLRQVLQLLWWQLSVSALGGFASTQVTAQRLGSQELALECLALGLPSACAPHNVLPLQIISKRLNGLK